MICVCVERTNIANASAKSGVFTVDMIKLNLKHTTKTLIILGGYPSRSESPLGAQIIFWSGPSGFTLVRRRHCVFEEKRKVR